MKRVVSAVSTRVLFLTFVGLAYLLLAGPDPVSACNYGSPGGQDYVPQKRAPGGTAYNAPSITKEQAYDVIASHIKRVNPNLGIGKISDAGSFYEAEIVSESNEVVERLGVDKRSGRLILLN
jgi:hypothetical protein